MDAIEQRKYGWFWECPNGGASCKYRHALPPGFILKPRTLAAQDEDEEEPISIEEFLETERHRLGSNLTPVTEASFLKWKADRIKKQADEASAKAKKKEAEIKAGRTLASGRELFVVNPELFQMDDDEAMEEDQLMDREEDVYEQDKENIQEDLYLEEDLEALNMDDDNDDDDKEEKEKNDSDDSDNESNE